MTTLTTTKTATTATQTNVETAREALELLATGATAGVDSFDRLFAPNVRHYGPARDFCPADLLMQGQPETFAGFSERSVEIHELSPIGNRVMAQITFSGRHTGEFQHHAGNGAVREAKGLVMFRFSGGRIVEASSVLHWR